MPFLPSDTDKNDPFAKLLVVVEKLFLVLVVIMTITSAGLKLVDLISPMEVTLGDILLMFLCAEIIAMVLVFYTGKGSPYVFPIFIAITVLARLIVLQGKDMDPQRSQSSAQHNLGSRS